MSPEIARRLPPLKVQIKGHRNISLRFPQISGVGGFAHVTMRHRLESKCLGSSLSSATELFCLSTSTTTAGGQL